MSTTIRSTTGTAPVTITDRGDGTVYLLHEDGTGQVYRLADLLGALLPDMPGIVRLAAAEAGAR